MTKSHGSGLHSRKGRFMAILALGSICGLIEVTLSGALRAADFPWRTGVLVGLGFGIVAFALAIYRKPLMALWIALVAILVKQLAVPVLGAPIACKANTCLAVGLEYAALAGIAALAWTAMQGHGGLRAIVGGAGAAVGSVAFLLIGVHVAPCAYLLSFNQAGGFAAYLYRESLNWALFSAVLFPVGWAAGVKSEAALSRLFESQPRLVYAGASSLAAVCWVASAIAMASGM